MILLSYYRHFSSVTALFLILRTEKSYAYLSPCPDDFTHIYCARPPRLILVSSSVAF